MFRNSNMRILLTLLLATTLINAQAPAPSGGRGGSGRGGFGRGPNYNGPPEASSAAYPGTVAATEATEKLIAAVKAAAPKPGAKPSKKAGDAALEAQIRAVLDPPPPP